MFVVLAFERKRKRKGGSRGAQPPWWGVWGAKPPSKNLGGGAPQGAGPPLKGGVGPQRPTESRPFASKPVLSFEASSDFKGGKSVGFHTLPVKNMVF